MKDGLIEEFYENGQLRSTGNYKDGKKDGLWYYYDGEGNPTKKEEWKDGKLIKQPSTKNDRRKNLDRTF